MNALTAAHPTLPFGSRVRVEREDDGRHVVVRINDRGPFTKGRVIDLSREAARRLGILAAGVASVRIVLLGKSSINKTRHIKAPASDRADSSDRTTEWYVFVGKFRKREIAKRFAERMRKRRLATRVVPSWHPVPKYFHVHIKGFPKKNSAVEMVTRLKGEGYNAYIVKGNE